MHPTVGIRPTEAEPEPPEGFLPEPQPNQILALKLRRKTAKPTAGAQEHRKQCSDNLCSIICIYIYIYIYMYGSNPSWWVRLGQKSQKIPSFTVKNAPNRHPPKRWVLFMSWHFVFFCFFVLFSPDSSYLPLFLDILKPKNGPPKGVIGRLYIEIYIYIYVPRKTTPWHETNTEIICQDFCSCIRAGASTGATCLRTEMSSLKNLASMWQ